MDLSSQVATTSRFAQSIPSLPAGSGSIPNLAQAHKSAQDFSSFFLSQSLESMYANISTDSMFGGGNGEAVYRSLLLQEYGKVMAQSGSGRNIVDAVQAQILRLQEQSGAPVRSSAPETAP
jgi:Rod binding domain-containing protein